MRAIILFILLAISFSLAREQADLAAQQRALDSIRADVEALKRIRLEKTNQLEKADAARYQNRSVQNQAYLEYQNEARILEGNYSRVSDNISRMATELGALRNLATEQKDRAEASRNSLDNFYLQVKQAVDKSIEEIPQDFPAKKEERLLNFASNPPTIETFFNDRFDRLALTQTQELAVKDSYRLRLGTIFFADAAWGQSSDIQAVLRTGSLTGKVFEWRSAFSKELSADIKQTVFNAQQGAEISWVPIDILQTKSILGASMGVDQTRLEKLFGWFKAGGIVMYPLILVALAALFIALDRIFVLWKRGHISKTFTGKLQILVKNNQISEAKILCKKQKTSLGRILGSIVDNCENGKEQALKALQEILLAEQSKLEKRMGFLAALGTVAPLLGLLGTVTGMILLFQVITQVGTNDARLLAGGISEALITTETGLIIAIPVMLIHGKLSETLNFITTEIRIQSLALLNIFWKDE
ncbi:MAG: MotA/TolQ/ExbB proton channel family protein [Fibromonadales bacterium]|nr:MotA/TolQ/ExbB proton channel family protein [Fibromonadales bacterium]